MGRLSITYWRRDPDGEEIMRPLDLGLIRRVLACMRPYQAKRNWLFFFVLLRAVQLPLMAWVIGQVINGPVAGKDATAALWGAGAYLSLAAFTQFSFHFRQRLALELGEAVVHDLRNQIFAHLQSMRMSFFNRTKLGRIISRMTSDVEAMRMGVQEVLFVGLVGVGQMTIAAMCMLYYDGALFCLMAAMAPVLWGLNHLFRRKLSRAYREVQESFSRVTATLAESVGGVRVTQGFARQDVNAELFRELADDHAGYNMSAARTAGMLLPALELNSQVFIAGLLLIGGYRVLNPDIDMPIGNLVQFFFLASNFFQPIQMLGNQYNQAMTAMAGAERVFKLLDTPSDWTDPPDAVAMPRIEGRVEFERVSFAYVPDRTVLHEISFAAQPGQTIALVGHTGSGKSTIANLVNKFYLPTSGRVLIDGHDTRHIETESLRRQLGIVLQQNFLFSGTVLENILIGKPAATEEEVCEAARQLDCLDLLQALPTGLQTQVGERGGSLSLGQRQLVCFTRAMLADPRILILDEATSSVDCATELRIQRALKRLLANRTSFIVAHRLSTIRHADLVLVLDQGRIVERGTHDSLLASGGAYASLYAQFARSHAA